MKPNLYVLLIGINEYEDIRPLRACERDIERVSKYLNDNWSDVFHIKEKTLTSADAKKKAIVEHFVNHLGQATADDAIFFYFSGHGGQEKADEVFLQSESDGKLEFLACHDSNITTNQNFLSDKELRFLLNKVGQNGASINVFFDCCHAGDNFRDIQTEYVERLTGTNILPKRDWSEFIFSQAPYSLKPQDFEGKILNDVLPYPDTDFFHFAACTSYQSALESKSKKEGLFTAALLSVLENSNETLSYYEIINKVRVKLKQLYRINQTPLLYFKSKNDEAIHKPLFGKHIKQKPLHKTVYFDIKSLSWKIDWGQIHGVKEMEEELQVLVINKEEEQFWAHVKTANIDYSLIEFEPYADISKSETYKGYIGGVMTNDLNLYITGDPDNVALIKQVYEQDNSYQDGQRIFLSDYEKDADFTLLVDKNKQCQISKPFDTARPWVNEISIEEDTVQLFNTLANISKWLYVKNLQHPNIVIPDDAIQVTIKQKNTAIQPQSGVYPLQLNTEQDKMGEVYISFTNSSDIPLYIGLAALSTQFGIFNGLLEEGVTKLDPKETVHLMGGRPLKFQWDDYLDHYGWEEDTLRIQTMISTIRFTIDDFEQQRGVLRTARGNNDLEAKSWIPEQFVVKTPWQEQETWRTKYLEFKVKKS